VPFSHVVPATTADEEPVVLKVQFPHRESDHEALALALWDGDGAVRLLDHDPDHAALLLERCHPGTHLSRLDPDAALDVVVGLLPRLWRPAGPPITTLAEEADHLASGLAARWVAAGRPFPRRLLDVALAALRSLPVDHGEPVLLHQDLHADNVLAATREPWLVIDPKPLVGEREFGVVPLVRAYELGHSPAAVRHRLDRLTADLGLDRERARLWAIAHTVAWAFDDHGRVLPRHVETAGWLLDGF